MSDAAVLLPYHIAFGIETTLICIGNAFTMSVFWNQRHSLRRASSLFSLLVISLERACAVIWPFRHLIARIRIYVTSILMVWLAGFCVATVNGLAVCGLVSHLTSFSFNSCTFFICLCLVLATYLTIRRHLRNIPPVCTVGTQIENSSTTA